MLKLKSDYFMIEIAKVTPLQEAILMLKSDYFRIEIELCFEQFHPRFVAKIRLF